MTDKICTIGIDIGTTSAKVLCVDKLGQTITRTQERLDLISTVPGMAEQNPEYVYTTIMNLLTNALAVVKNKGFVPQLIGMSTAMHSLIVIDEKNQPLTNAILWLDGRAGAVANRLWQSTGKAIYAKTGTPIHAMSPLVKLIWLRQESAQLFAKNHRFVSLKEWIWHKWFDEWCVDESIASATGLFNLSTRQWDESALDLAGISQAQLSRVVETSYIRTGTQNAALLAMGNTPQTAFNIGASDGVLANLALQVIQPGAMVMTIGTSLAIRTGQQQPITDESLRSFCYVLDKGHYIIGAPSNNGGILLDWLHRQIFNDPTHMNQVPDLSTLCAQGATIDTDGLYCIPYIAGERAPVWDENATATFFGLKMHHQQIHLIRTAIEGILFNAYTICEKLIRVVGQPEYIVTSGKLFVHPWIRQFAADLFGVKVCYQELMDASTIGAINLATFAQLGTADCISFENNLQAVETQIPDATRHKHYQNRHHTYLKLYEAIAGIATNRTVTP